MKRRHIALITVLALIIVIVISVANGWLMYGWGTVMLTGPGPILKLLPYECEDRRTVFPQWINNDEICYLELVLHYDDYSNEKMPFFLKGTVMDIYIYREKANRPETKKLIKHIIMGNIEPGLSQASPSNKDLGFKVYDNGRKMFLYYGYYGVLFTDYRYMTMNINGSCVRKSTIPMFPFDISQDGKWIFGIEEEMAPWITYKKVLEDGTTTNMLERSGEPKYYVAKYLINDETINKITQITEDMFKQSRKGDIKDLKLVADDKLVLTYTNDVNKSPRLEYTYLIDIPSGYTEFIEDPGKVFDENDARFDIFGDSLQILTPDRTYAMTKDKKYLISGNNCIYEKQDDNWIKIKDFFKNNPVISPDGKKILYYDILTEKGLADYSPDYIRYLGEKLAVSDIKTIFEEEKK